MNNFLLKKSTYYYLGLLGEQEKQIYKILLHAILNMKANLKLSGIRSTEQLKNVSRYIINDRPDIFWYRGAFTVTSCNGIIESIEFHYIYTEAQRDRIVRDMETSSLYGMLNTALRAEKSDFDKALKLYEAIIRNTEYEKRAVGDRGGSFDYAYGIEGVMLNRRAVCAGYAKAFQYFAEKHDIWCTVVTAQTRRERHAWNLINLYGDYYYIDTTWGDPIFTNAPSRDPDYVSYDFFCITTSDLMASHKPSFDVSMPLCTATKYNYYEYFGMIDSVYSAESAARHIVNAVRSGKKEALIKYSSQSAYTMATTRLFRDREIFDALKSASRYVPMLKTDGIKYSLDDEKRIISLKL